MDRNLTLTIIKLTLTPLLMLMVSYISRRLGSLIGGVVSGLPLTSGPISAYLAIEQGEIFASSAAESTLSGISAVLISYLSYSYFSGFLSIVSTCIVSLSIYDHFVCASELS
jgi:hypothetical protein